MREGPDEGAPTGQQTDGGGQSEYEQLSIDDALGRLQTTREGLSADEAKRRLSQYGPNELVEHRRSPILVFLGHFWGPIPWMIEIAAALSAVVAHWADLIIILVLLLANAVVGFWEEHQAGNTIAALKAKLAPQARVRRGGEWQTVPARELAPGDIVRLRLGEVAPADAKLLEGDEIEVDQSALTGESLPVARNAGQVVYSGSIVRRGEIEAAVYATGERTYFGKTAQLVEEAKTASHFQRAVLRIGDYLIVIAAVLAVVIIVLALLRHERFLTVLQFVLVLTVAAIPVAMPTVLSVTMAVGARKLAKGQAIVARLSSIEELAGVDVLCSDKTGTLTQNKLTLGDPYVVEGVTPAEVILAGALASRAEDKDPIDLAVLAGVRNQEEAGRYHVAHFTPFDPVHKRTEAAVAGPAGTCKVTKGAPQVILALAANRGAVEEGVNRAVGEFASRGFRSLGVARTDEQGQWQLMGILPLFDPPRPDSKETIAAAGQMGVKTKMITGDQVAIAKETARQLGLGENILDAQVFEGRQATDPGLQEQVEQADGFAQVFPEHKFTIISALQERKHIVGMTGDGVNDAPPLKKADAGIAVSGASDAARAAAAIVLLAPGLSVIIDALRESRRIFTRMTNYAIYRITETIRVLLFITASILVLRFYPVTAIMIVLLALLNDGAVLTIAYDRVHYSDRPEAWDMRLVLGLATVLGLIGVIESFLLLYIIDQVVHVARPIIQSIIYLKLSVAGHFTLFVARVRGPFWSIRPAWVLLGAVIGTQIVATLITVYGLFMHAIGWKWAGIVWGYTLVWFLIEDGSKLLTLRVIKPKAARETGGEPREERK